jgi:hypothetical protein
MITTTEKFPSIKFHGDPINGSFVIADGTVSKAEGKV